jgi:Ca-activated chloride channel family protein|tara:strand:+ start:110 stop:1108 length:999 start_codon:yes stop_codon:yes gene_type:complete
MLNLLWPWALALAPLPFIYRWLRRPADVKIQALRAPLLAKVALDDSASIKTSSWQRRLLLIVLSLCWLSALLAIARPVWIGAPVSMPTNGRDILLAVDISGSMEQEDMRINGREVNRLIAVKAVVGDFVVKREGDRLGLILFGEKAYLQTPLTFDRKTMQTLLNEAQIGFAGSNGTAIGDAVGLAVKRLQDRPENHRVVILLTDGSNNAGELDPMEAADLARRAKVKIYTVGIGAESQQSWGLFGSQVTNPSADLDESALQGIADATGGQFFRARDPEELAAIYRELNRLEPLEQTAETIRPVSTLFHWPLALTFFLSLVLVLSRSYRRDYA